VKKYRDAAIAALASALIALAFGWWVWHPKPVHEGPAFGRTLPSGAVEVPRNPDAPVPAPVKKAAKEAGGKLERSISLTIQPEPIQAPPETVAQPSTPEGPQSPAAAPGCSCAPVRVDLGLVRMPDHTRRVVATAEGGTILDSIDIPIDAAVSKRETRWAAGALYTPPVFGRRAEYGAFVDRDLGPLRLGVEVQQRREGLTAVVRAGIRF